MQISSLQQTIFMRNELFTIDCLKYVNSCNWCMSEWRVELKIPLPIVPIMFHAHKKMCIRESQWILTCFCYCSKRYFASLQHKVVIFYVKSLINGNISILNKSIMWKRTRLIKLNYFSCEVLYIIFVSQKEITAWGRMLCFWGLGHRSCLYVDVIITSTNQSELWWYKVFQPSS